MPYDPSSNSQLTFILALIPTILSSLACLWTIYNCSKLPISTNVSLKFILIIIIFDFALSCTHLLEVFHEFGFNSICKVEASLRPVLYTGNFCLAMLMGILSYRALAEGETFDQGKFFFRSIFGTFGLSLALIYLFLFSGFYTIVQENSHTKICHLQREAGLSPTKKFIATIFLNNTFLIGLGLIILMIIYVKIVKIMKSMQISITGKTGGKTLKLLYFPTIQIFIALPGIMFHALDYPDWKWLQIVYVVVQHSVGLINSIVFGLQMKSFYARRHKETQLFLRISSESASSEL